VSYSADSSPLDKRTMLIGSRELDTKDACCIFLTQIKRFRPGMPLR
jgi:hypothetical protein